MVDAVGQDRGGQDCSRGRLLVARENGGGHGRGRPLQALLGIKGDRGRSLDAQKRGFQLDLDEFEVV